MIQVPVPPVEPGTATRFGRGDHDDGGQTRRHARPRRGLPFPRGGVEVVRANRGYTLYSRRTDGPVARLRPTGDGDKVQVMWWRGQAWAAPGDFGPVVMPLDQALQFIATEGFFWINA